jgi:hypothetical protein
MLKYIFPNISIPITMKSILNENELKVDLCALGGDFDQGLIHSLPSITILLA